MQAFQTNSEEENNAFIKEVIKELQKYKQRLYEQLELKNEKIEKVLPMFHLLIHLFTFYKFSDRELLRNLA